MIEFVTLGRPTIRRHGKEISGIAGHRQKLALLAYLALEGPVTRDRLLSVFWPDRDEERARHSLSQVLYALRRELGERYLRVEAESVGIVPDLWIVDVSRMEEAVAEGEWGTAVELYCGPFLHELVLPGAPEFEKWQTSVAARTARTVRKAFRHLVEDQVAVGDLVGALTTSSRWAAIDPLEDEAQHVYITLLARSGDRSSAIEHFETYRARLAEELGVEPLDGTIALVRRIRVGEIPEFRPLSPVEGEDDGAGAREQAAQGAKRGRPADLGALLSELRRRHVLHIGAAYLVVAWLAIQFANALVEGALLPDWVFRVVLFFLLVGFPFTVILAWAQEPATAAEAGTGSRLGWIRRTRGTYVLGLQGVLVLTLLVAWLAAERGLSRTAGLDPSRIVVFPFAVTPEGNEQVGEDIATLLGYALETTGGYRFVDGWYGTDELAAAGLRNLSERTATVTTRTLGAAYYVRGRVRLGTDSARIVVELHDIVGDSLVARAFSEGPTDAEWVQRESEQIARELLAAITLREDAREPGPRDSEKSAAMLQFTAGEREYRRARFRQALDYFRRAVELDSTYAPAALRGALAACWLREYDQAARLVEVALSRSAFLPPHRAHFASGLRDYLAGAADSAVTHFRQALEIAPEMWEAAARLGEVYAHLLPEAAPLDSLAEAAFLRVHEQVPDFFPVLFHLIEFAVRRGEAERADRYLRRLRKVDPDSTLLAAAELMVTCAKESPDMVDWATEARRRPTVVYEAAQSLGNAAFQAACARAGWTAILAHDTATDAGGFNRRFGALLGLQSLLVAEGRTGELLQLLDDHPEYPGSIAYLYILDLAAGADVEARAVAAGESLRPAPVDYEPAGLDLWFLGLLATARGDTARASAMADSLAALAARRGERVDRVMAASMEARVALLRGDTARALSLLQALKPTARPADVWTPWESLAGERMALAELLYAAGRYEEAIRVASTLDAPARPAADLIQLPASLALRLRAARRIGDAGLERRARDRLRTLGRDDLIGPDR
jgi:DNA-binding SARP family transcriptional activator/tetratricopeptide (TPR) repeat protein